MDIYKHKKRWLFIAFLTIELLIFGGLTLHTIMNTAPVELTGDYSVDQLLLSIDRDILFIDIELDFITSLVCSISFFVIYCSFRLYTAPIITVNVRLKSKACDVRLTPSKIGYAPYFSYALNFETDSGDELKLFVGFDRYALYFEGNKGILKYKEFLRKSFVDFYIEEVS